MNPEHQPAPTSPRELLRASSRRWFHTRPRLHGEVDRDRTVSNLELFYDLVFVVIVAQLAHHVVGHTTWRTVGEFAVLFGLMWAAWLNGSLYHELHGREDGRHRTYIFVQMYFLVALAAFAGDATGDAGPRFAATYAGLMLLITYQWWTVSRLDVVESFRRSSRRYVLGILLIVALVAASTVTGPDARLALWAASIAVTVVGYLGVAFQRRGPEGSPMHVTESMIERFGLFTIIVLGEVVTGVVNGILDADATPSAVLLGMLALSIGFGLWWNYFDALGHRVPRDTPPAMVGYLMLHLPLHGAIAAAGGGMVGLIEHGAQGHLDAATCWLVCGSTATVMIVLVALMGLVEDPPRATRSIQLVVGTAALVILALGATGLDAVRLSVAIGAVMGVVWTIAFVLMAVHGDHEREHAHGAGPQPS